MPRESKKSKTERAIKIADLMNERYPHTGSLLDSGGDPFRLTIAVLLSAQTTDKGVNKVTPLLWQKYPTVQDLAQANPTEVEEIVRPLGYYHSKAANCIKCAQMILADYGGIVPHTMEELQKLPGVGRKTANIVLNEAFGIVEGIAVDTHVFRIAHLLKLTNAKTADKTEQDLLSVFPKKYWQPINKQWVLFGREICIANRPKCDVCFISDYCPSRRK